MSHRIYKYCLGASHFAPCEIKSSKRVRSAFYWLRTGRKQKPEAGGLCNGSVPGVAAPRWQCQGRSSSSAENPRSAIVFAATSQQASPLPVNDEAREPGAFRLPLSFHLSRTQSTNQMAHGCGTTFLTAGSLAQSERCWQRQSQRNLIGWGTDRQKDRWSDSKWLKIICKELSGRKGGRERDETNKEGKESCS